MTSPTQMPNPPRSRPRAAAKPSGARRVHAPKLNGKNVRLKLLKWLVFEVLFSMLALAFQWAHYAARGDCSKLGTVIAHGELLLVSAAIVAAGVGDLAKAGLTSKLRGTKMTLIGGGMAVVATSAWFYSEVASSVDASDGGVKPAVAVCVSGVVAVVSLALSIACMIAAEVR